MAFLFSVFRARPSPFYLLDEVEAALDDVNLHRFLDLVHEFRNEAQLLIVSHQKRTMEAGDCLYGVSMAAGRSSRVVSQRIDECAATKSQSGHRLSTGRSGRAARSVARACSRGAGERDRRGVRRAGQAGVALLDRLRPHRQRSARPRSATTSRCRSASS